MNTAGGDDLYLPDLLVDHRVPRLVSLVITDSADLPRLREYSGAASSNLL